MAKGYGLCPDCQRSTRAESEKEYPAGYEVVYVCDYCTWTAKVFEDK